MCGRTPTSNGVKRYAFFWRKSACHIADRCCCGLARRPNCSRDRLWSDWRHNYWHRRSLHRQLAVSSARVSSWCRYCCRNNFGNDRRNSATHCCKAGEARRTLVNTSLLAATGSLAPPYSQQSSGRCAGVFLFLADIAFDVRRSASRSLSSAFVGSFAHGVTRDQRRRRILECYRPQTQGRPNRTSGACCRLRQGHLAGGPSASQVNFSARGTIAGGGAARWITAAQHMTACTTYRVSFLR